MLVSISRKIKFFVLNLVSTHLQFPTHLMDRACKVTDANGWENERQLKKRKRKRQEDGRGRHFILYYTSFYILLWFIQLVSAVRV